MATRRFSQQALLIVGFLNLMSAAAGGAGIAATNGLGMPKSWLAGSPFASYLWPGLVLLVVVGGTQAIAVVLQLRKSRLALAAAAVAGFGMIIWIYVEVTILPVTSWLQPAYFATGTLQVVLVLLALGVLPGPATAKSDGGAPE
jgi:hypothetical protein